MLVDIPTVGSALLHTVGASHFSLQRSTAAGHTALPFCLQHSFWYPFIGTPIYTTATRKPVPVKRTSSSSVAYRINTAFIIEHQYVYRSRSSVPRVRPLFCIRNTLYGKQRNESCLRSSSFPLQEHGVYQTRAESLLCLLRQGYTSFFG
jgi:hypothetical protein